MFVFKLCILQAKQIENNEEKTKNSFETEKGQKNEDSKKSNNYITIPLVEPCAPSENICKNNGTCLQHQHFETVKYDCTCGQNFTGEFCETEISECKRNPCQNGASCYIENESNTVCECLPNTTGQFCEKACDPGFAFDENGECNGCELGFHLTDDGLRCEINECQCKFFDSYGNEYHGVSVIGVACEEHKSVFCTELLMAAAFGPIENVQKLVRTGSDLNKIGKIGNRPEKTGSPLMLAAVHNNIPVIKYLLDSGADSSIRDFKNDSVITKTSRYGNRESLKFLVEYGGMDIEEIGAFGQTSFL